MTYKPKGEDRLTAVREFRLEGVTIGVFPGSRGYIPEHDILIKYQEDGKRVRTPKHIHWVIDILIKKEHNKDLTMKFLRYLREMYDEVKGFENEEDRNNCEITETTKEKLKDFLDLNNYGEYSIEFIGYLIELMIKMEKNMPPERPARVFKELMDAMLREEEIFTIVSKATQNS